MIKDTNSNQEKLSLIHQIRELESSYIQFIHERLGIVIRHQTPELHKTLLSACNQFTCSPKEYLNNLMIASNDSPLLEHLIEGITIGETYFFRDKHQMQLIQDMILPELIRKKREENNLNLRIWSAGCSSGEEIYTIAMLLLKLIPDMNQWTLQLLGTDINTQMLHKAIQGHYTEWSMRSITDYFKKLYFSEDKNIYSLSPMIKNLVNFSYLNLNEDSYPSIFNGTNAQDFILCRNVFIYFDNTKIEKFMNKFYQCLLPGSYLLLGASDPIQQTHFIFQHQKGSLFFKPLQELKKEEKRIIAPVKKSELLPVQKKPKSVIPQKSTEKIKENAIQTLLQESQWQEIVNLIDNYPKKDKSAFLFNAQATALANMGKLDAAIQICKESLLLDATNKYTYFTFALILSELNKLDESETAFRKTLFLDYQFVAGHFQLGLLLLRKKQIESGIKSLKNALSIASTRESSEMVPGSQGLSYGRLAEILQHEIALYA